jgi:hypothetical protein
MAKLGLADDEETHRRVQAVLTFLGHRGGDVPWPSPDTEGPSRSAL